MQYERASFSFTRAVQPKDYETSKATGELSVVFEEGEQPDIEQVLQDLSEKCQSHVLSAVGKDPSAAKLAERKVNGGTSTAKVEEKDKPPVSDEPKEHAADKAAKAEQEPTHEEAGSDPAADISDDDIKTAARAKAKQDKQFLTTLVQKYGLNRLTDAQGETRAKVYAELTE